MDPINGDALGINENENAAAVDGNGMEDEVMMEENNNMMVIGLAAPGVGVLGDNDLGFDGEGVDEN